MTKKGNRGQIAASMVPSLNARLVVDEARILDKKSELVLSRGKQILAISKNFIR